MKRELVLVVGVVTAFGCGEDERGGAIWMPTEGTEATGLEAEAGTSDDDDDESTTGADPSGMGTGETGDSNPNPSDGTPQPTDGDPTDGDPTEGDTDGDPTDDEPVDCTPAWTTPWIGSPCMADADCSFDGGECLQDGEGFPCGTCTQSCATTCPDEDGTPVTYCVNGVDVGLSDAGYCLSKCDMPMLGGNGCRDGYVCNVLRRYDETGVSGVCIPEEFDAIDPGDGLVEEINHAFLIDHLGGDPVNPFDYGPDLDSFQMYLDAVGVQHTTGAEIVEPYNQAAATGCGYTILLPEREFWERAAALAMFTDELTELVGEPIFMRNWWRPPCYNSAVGGAANGDHPDADAVDLDFMSATSRAMAQQFLCATYWNQDIVQPEQIAPGVNLDPRLNMSVGLGGVTIHLGVLSSGGRRDWKYASYSSEPNSGNCW